MVFSLAWPQLTRFAAQALGNEADAQDAAQLGLEKIFAQVSSYDRERSAMAWCLAVVSWEFLHRRGPRGVLRRANGAKAELATLVPRGRQRACNARWLPRVLVRRLGGLVDSR